MDLDLDDVQPSSSSSSSPSSSGGSPRAQPRSGTIAAEWPESSRRRDRSPSASDSPPRKRHRSASASSDTRGGHNKIDASTRADLLNSSLPENVKAVYPRVWAPSPGPSGTPPLPSSPAQSLIDKLRCKVCQKDLGPALSTLKAHTESQDHTNGLKLVLKELSGGGGLMRFAKPIAPNPEFSSDNLKQLRVALLICLLKGGIPMIKVLLQLVVLSLPLRSTLSSTSFESG